MKEKSESVKVEIINFKPTHVEMKFSSTEVIIKMEKQFFRQRMNAGYYEVLNPMEMPFVT